MHHTHTNTAVSLLLGETPQALRAPATQTQVSWPTYLSLLQPLCWCNPPQFKKKKKKKKCYSGCWIFKKCCETTISRNCWWMPCISFHFGSSPSQRLASVGGSARLLSWLYLAAVARALLAVNYKTTSVRLRSQQVHSTVAEGLPRQKKPPKKNWASDFLLIICSLVIGRLSRAGMYQPFCQRSRVLITVPGRRVKHFYLDNWQSGKKKKRHKIKYMIWFGSNTFP